MRVWYFSLKKTLLISFIVLVFVSSSHAMNPFSGDIEYDGTTGITRCTCRYNTSQFTDHSNTLWDIWGPNVVIGLGICVLTDLLRYDVEHNRSKSVIWHCLKFSGRKFYEGFKELSGCCKKSSNNIIEKSKKDTGQVSVGGVTP